MGEVTSGLGFRRDDSTTSSSRVTKPRFAPVKLSERRVKKILDRGLTGADLARNPHLDPSMAASLAQESFLRSTATRTASRIGGVLKERNPNIYTPDFDLSDVKDGPLEGTSLLQEYRDEVERLRRAFIDTEVERQFGPQNITSRTSTVNAQGVRVLVPGQTATTRPTREQVSKITEGFRTPLELLQSGQPAKNVAGLNPRSPTIVSGRGVRRRSMEPTILTSDSDSRRGGTLGGSTILG